MVTVKLFKKSLVKKMGARLAKGAAAPPTYGIMDNEDGTFTVVGVDSAGAPVDISAVATLAAVSDTPTVFSVDPPVGMLVTGHGLLPGSANVTFTATWLDASVGPYSIVLPVSCTGGPAVGITVTPGVPTIRP